MSVEQPARPGLPAQVFRDLVLHTRAAHGGDFVDVCAWCRRLLDDLDGAATVEDIARREHLRPRPPLFS